MKHFKLIFIGIFFSGISAFSQGKMVYHTVLKGETIYKIARLYNISQNDIYKINPDSQQVLKLNQVLLIPALNTKKSNKLNDTTTDFTEKTHQVLAKETKYGIAKQYGISISDLEKANPILETTSLKIGQNISIPNKEINTNNVIVEKEVLKMEPKKVVTVKVIPKTTIAILPLQTKLTRTNNFLNQLVNTALENLGSCYQIGGTTKAGFDCSGLMIATFETIAVKLPRSSFEQAEFGAKINIEDAEKGDLIFFKTNGSELINHVGMVTKVIEGEIQFIHASTQSGVIISSTKETYYGKNLVQVNRVF